MTQVFLELRKLGLRRDERLHHRAGRRRRSGWLGRGEAAMLKDITLGQYFPGNSVIHRLDPRTKLIAAGRSTSWRFSWPNPLWAMPDGVLLSVPADRDPSSGIPGRSIVRGLKPLVIILVFTGVLNLFFTKGGRLLVDFWGITITYRQARARRPSHGGAHYAADHWAPSC